MAVRMKMMRMMLAMLLYGAAMMLTSCNGVGSAGTGTGALPTEKVVIGGETFTLELAADPQTRERGLMHRTSIPDHGGMLFVFPDNEVRRQQFWMGHCLVDIDIIFLDRMGTVTAVHRMKAQSPQAADETDDQYRARIPHYPSGLPAQFAIELQAGTLDRLNVRVNDRIALDLPRLKRQAR